MIREVFSFSIVLLLICGIYAIHDPDYSHEQHQTKGYRQDGRIDLGGSNSEQPQGQRQTHFAASATITRTTTSTSGRSSQLNLGESGNSNYRQETTRGGHYGTNGASVGAGQLDLSNSGNSNYHQETARGGHYGTSGASVGGGHLDLSNSGNSNYHQEATRGGYYGTSGASGGGHLNVSNSGNSNYHQETTSGGYYGTRDNSGGNAGAGNLELSNSGNSNYHQETSRGVYYGTRDNSGGNVGGGHMDLSNSGNSNYHQDTSRGGSYGTRDNSGTNVGGEHTNYNHNTESTVSSYRTECPPNATGPFPYLMDCRKFLNCWKGRGVVQPCAPGTVFNAETLECDNPEKVVCYSYNSAQSVGYQSGQSSGSNRLARMENVRDYSSPGSASRSDKSSVKCSPNYSGLEPHPYDCAKFLNCANGVTHIQDCGPGTVFNPLMSVCDWPYNVDCGNREHADGNVVVEASEVHSTQYNGDEKQYDYQGSGTVTSHNQNGYHQASTSQTVTQTSHGLNYGSGNTQGGGTSQTSDTGFGSYSQHRHGQGTIHQEGVNGTGSGVYISRENSQASGRGQTNIGGVGSNGATHSQHRHGQGSIHQESHTGTGSGTFGSSQTSTGGDGPYISTGTYGQGSINQEGQASTAGGFYITRGNNEKGGYHHSYAERDNGAGTYTTSESQQRQGQGVYNRGDGSYTTTGSGQTYAGTGVYIPRGNNDKGDYHHSYTDRQNQNIGSGQINNGGTYINSEGQDRHSTGVYNRGDGGHTTTGSGSYSGSGTIEHRRNQNINDGTYQTANQGSVTNTNSGTQYHHDHGSYKYDDGSSQAHAAGTGTYNSNHQYSHDHSGDYQRTTNTPTQPDTHKYGPYHQHQHGPHCNHSADGYESQTYHSSSNSRHDNSGSLTTVYGNRNSDEEDRQTTMQQTIPFHLEGNENTVWATRVDGQSSVPIFTTNIDHRQGHHISVDGSTTTNSENENRRIDSSPIYHRPGSQTQTSAGSQTDYQHHQTTSTTQSEDRWPYSRAPSHSSSSSYDIQQATVHRIQPSNYEVHENINESSPSSNHPKTITTTYFYAEEPKVDVDELDEFSGTVYGGDISGTIVPATYSRSFNVDDGQQLVHLVPPSVAVDLSTTSSNRHIAIIDPSTPVFATEYDPSSNLYGGLQPPHFSTKPATIVETYSNVFQDQDQNDPFLLQDLGLPQPSDHLLPPLLGTPETNEPRTQFTFDPSLTRFQPQPSHAPTVEPPARNINDRRPSFTFDPTLRNPSHNIPGQDSTTHTDLNQSRNNEPPNISYSPSYSSVLHSRNVSVSNAENPFLTRTYTASESTNIQFSLVNNKTAHSRFNSSQTENIDNPNNSPQQSTIFYDREEVRILPRKSFNETEPSPVYSRMIPVRPIATSSPTSSTPTESSYTSSGNYYYEESKSKNEHNTDAEIAGLPISEALKALLRPYFNRSGTITEDTANKMDEHIMKITKPGSGSVKDEDDDVNQTELIFAGEQEILNTGISGRNEENNVSNENFQSQSGITFNRHISKSNEDDVEVIGTDETNIGYRGMNAHHRHHSHGHSEEYHRNHPNLPNPFLSGSQQQENSTTTTYNNNNNDQGSHGHYGHHGHYGQHDHHGHHGHHDHRGPHGHHTHRHGCNHNAEWHKRHGLPMPDNFDCQNGVCIKQSQVCDGVNNCGNNLDESNCADIGYEVRLSNEDGSLHMGRVEVKVKGKWGYVCDDSFGIKDADVLCRELGYPLGANEVRGNSFYQPHRNMVDETGRIRFSMDKVECNGNETSLKECKFNGWGNHNCDANEVVGVVCKQSVYVCPNDYWQCKTGQECIFPSFVCDNVHDCTDHSDESPEFCNSTVEYRLVGGIGQLDGRLEVKYRGVWGTVCGDRFTRDAAQVVCNSMNLFGNARVIENVFGSGNGPIWLDEVSCLGTEPNLDQCSHHAWGEHNCNHSEDVAIRCSSDEFPSQFTNDPDNEDSSQWSIKIMQRSLNFQPECGKISTNLNDSINNQFMERVIQGTKAKKGHHPWQATVRAKGVHGKSTHWCGAVLISQRHVLTAAHCLTGFAKGAYFIRLGDHFSDVTEPSEIDVQIENWYIHENFRKGQHMNNDIALVKLKSPVQYTEYIQPACLPNKDSELKVGENCTISGWGSIQSGVSTPSNDLRFAKVPILSPSICKQAHVYGNTITDGMFCAGFLDEGVDACDGDSGGPLTCTDEESETVFGIISWGQHCGYSNKPGVYVNVVYYLDWIDEKLKLLS